MLNALTIDVEDYYHVTAFEDQVPRSRWDDYPSRVVDNTRRLLRMFERRGVRATFFVLGWVGRRHPELVREIAAAGHDVGCHGYWHRLIYKMTPEEFRADLTLARDVLEDIVGKPVVAYRAPCFSVARVTMWALDILRDEGFRYDSSIHPIWHDRYGIPDANRFPHLVAGGGLWEFPPTVLKCGPANLPVSGGGYFRLYPVRFTAACLSWVNWRHRCPFMFYIHPWEVDPDQPRMPCPRGTRWRHYLNLHSTAGKLDRLLGWFRFGPLSEALEQYQGVREPEPLYARHPAAV